MCVVVMVVHVFHIEGILNSYSVRCKFVLRKNFLTNRAVCIWNSLPNKVVSAESVNSFKSRLDRFWSQHDFVYDYRASPLDTRSYM